MLCDLPLSPLKPLDTPSFPPPPRQMTVSMDTAKGTGEETPGGPQPTCINVHIHKESVLAKLLQSVDARLQAPKSASSSCGARLLVVSWVSRAPGGPPIGKGEGGPLLSASLQTGNQAGLLFLPCSILPFLLPLTKSHPQGARRAKQRVLGPPALSLPLPYPVLSQASSPHLPFTAHTPLSPLVPSCLPLCSSPLPSLPSCSSMRFSQPPWHGRL